ncbi:MAG: gliding motility-associated C-terminal domain-containing protein [Chitinophagaceae bacterium]|nr:gliding motility-associated C-terminal domain-containing protein [Chitinophagaceae bacterium]
MGKKDAAKAVMFTIANLPKSGIVLLVVLFAFNYCNAQSTDDGLVAYYTFCDCAAKDISGNHRDGIITGNPVCAKGIRDKGLLMNQNPGDNGCGLAGGEYIRLPKLDAIWSKGFSVCAWVKFDQENFYERIVDFSNDHGQAGGMPLWFGRQAATNDLAVESWISSDGDQARTTGKLIAPNVITNGKIEYYCATIHEDTMRIYVNGIMVAEKKGNPVMNVPRVNNFIGRSAWCWFDPDFKGFLDEVRIYNRALSASEIQTLFKTTNVNDFQVQTHCNSSEASFFLDTKGIDSVRWNFGDHSSSSLNTATGSNVTHHFSSPGTYPVQAVAYKYCSNDTITRQVTINFPLLSKDTAICSGGTLQLQAMAGALSYHWVPAQGLSDPAIANPIFTAGSQSANHQYAVYTKTTAGNLVNNGDFEKGNTGFYTNYTFCNTGNCLYPLASNGYSIGPDAKFYHVLFDGKDHSSGSGNFMIINGARPDLVVWRQTVPVNPNTNYAFGAWISTLIASNTASIRFSINGIQLGNIFSAPDIPNLWERYFTEWNSGSSTSAEIEIVNIYPEASGNDFGIDDIFFGEVVTCSGTVNINVNTMLVPQVSIATAGTTICRSENISFTATPVNGGASPSYQWKVNGNNAGINDAVFSSNTLSDNDIVTCVMTSDAICSAPASATSNSIQVSVLSQASPAISISASSTSICEGAEVSFTAHTVNAGASPAYQWKINGMDTGANDPVFATSSLTDGAVVTCTISGSMPCSSSPEVVSNPVVITVQPMVTPSVTINVIGNAVCPGSSISFNAIPLHEDNAPVYQWSINNAATGGNSPTFSSDQLQPGDEIKCILTSNASCISQPDAISNILTAPVKPAVTVTVEKNICEGDQYEGYHSSGTYTDVFTGSNGCDSTRTLRLTVKPKSYSQTTVTICEGEDIWGHTKTGTYTDIFRAENGCDSLRTLTLTVNPVSRSTIRQTICEGESFEGYTVAGTYSDAFMTANGCDSIRTLELSVTPLPQPFLGPDISICPGEQLRLYPGQFLTYSWQDGSTEQSFTATKAGLYTVTVTTDCGEAMNDIRVTEKNCEIYFPNAFTPNNDGRNDVFNILNAHDLQDYHLVIFNRLGQKIFETGDYRKGWDGRTKGIMQDNGIFIWQCHFKKSGVAYSMKGTVTIIR